MGAREHLEAKIKDCNEIILAAFERITEKILEND